ncbi:MAG: hypothetical protein ABEI97_00795 [Candidatus Nanohaloarchaea archaeon]
MDDVFDWLKSLLSGEEEPGLSDTGEGTLEQFRRETEENLDRQYDGPRQQAFAVDLTGAAPRTLQVYQRWQEQPFYELVLDTGGGRIGIDAATSTPSAYDDPPEQAGYAPPRQDAVAAVNYRVVNSPYFAPDAFDNLPSTAIRAGGHDARDDAARR